MTKRQFAAAVRCPETGLFDPYERQDDDCKLTAVVPKSHASLIRALYPTKGAFQRMLSMIVNDIILELEHKNIKYYTPQNEQEIIDAVKRRCTFAQHFGA